ncbi:MAG: DUF1501 domain-containing protein [Pseudomonadota bacterium]|nr:DUF1501 domain-containing protein [Pseudomonadota bacterium]
MPSSPSTPRRVFLRQSAALAGGLMLLRGGALAAAAGAPRLLLVFLRGGYDCASLLVPRGDFYRESRPNIAIACDGSAGAALPLDGDWSLHPALEGSLLPLWRGGQLAFVPFSGTPDLSRSHFETQDAIERGDAPGTPPRNDSGFLGRLVAELRDPTAISFTDQLPLVLRGAGGVPNVVLRGLAKPVLDGRQESLIAAMYRGTPYYDAVTEGFTARDEAGRELAVEMEEAGRKAANARGFEQEARRIARLMRDRHRIGFVDVGGWDTHVEQGAAKGALAARFGQLGAGLAGFVDEIGPAWNDTVVVVVSEFGRTFRENGNRGTDHGHGSVLWVLGGAIRGGQVRGEQLPVQRATLFQDRDYPVLNDYRDTLAGLFARAYGLDAAALGRVLPGAVPADRGLL